MAIVVESTSTSVFGSSSDTLTLNKPSGTVDGDFLIAIVANTGNTVTVTSVPSGWTLFDSRQDQGTLLIYWKVASSEPASWSWVFNTSGQLPAGGALRISGNVYEAPYVSIDDSKANTNTPTFNVGGVTPSAASSMLFIVTYSKDSQVVHSNWSVSTSNPSWTQQFSFGTLDTSGYALSCATATRPETTSTGTWSLTGDNDNDADYDSFLFAVQPSISVSTGVDSPGVLVISRGGELTFTLDHITNIDTPGTLTLNGNNIDIINQQNTVWAEDSKNSSTVWVEDNK